MPGLTPSATRTIRSPLIRLFPYIPILGDPTQVDQLLEFYHTRGREMEEHMGVGVGVRSNETMLSNIRVSFVCGESRAYLDACVDRFENFMLDIAGSRYEEACQDLPFDWNLRQKRSGKFLLTVRSRGSDVHKLMNRFNVLSNGMYPASCYRLCNQMTTIHMFENRTFVVTNDIGKICEEAGFEFVATKSTRIMLQYGSYDLAVFETGLVMIFGVLEGEDVDGNNIYGLQTAIQRLAKRVSVMCVDSERMMGALIQFGNMREIWDPRTAYKKKMEKCL
jgi:hypothetical protein